MTPRPNVLTALGALITHAWDNHHTTPLNLPDGWTPLAGLALQNVTEPEYPDGSYRWDVLGFGTGTTSVSLDRLPLGERDPAKIECGSTEGGKIGVVIFRELGLALQFKTAEGSQVRA
jgi:hypothetical protein